MTANQWDLCCGAPLKRGTKFIAVVDMAMAGVKLSSAALVLILLILFPTDFQDAQPLPPGQVEPVNIGFGEITLGLIMFMTISGLYFFLARYLLHGAQEMDINKINTWLRITIILFGIRAMFYFLGMISGTDLSAAIALTGIIGLSYSAYCVIVVYQFRKELLSEESNILKGSYYSATTNQLLL